MVERLICNQQVGGSSPSSGTSLYSWPTANGRIAETATACAECSGRAFPHNSSCPDSFGGPGLPRTPIRGPQAPPAPGFPGPRLKAGVTAGGGDSFAHRRGARPKILIGRQWNKSGHDKFGERRLTRRRFRPDPCYTAIRGCFEASRPMGAPVMARMVSTIVDSSAIRPRPRGARAGFPNRSRSNPRQSAGAAGRLAVAAAPPGARTEPAGARLRPRGTRKTVSYRDNVSRET